MRTPCQHLLLSLVAILISACASPTPSTVIASTMTNVPTLAPTTTSIQAATASPTSAATSIPAGNATSAVTTAPSATLAANIPKGTATAAATPPITATGRIVFMAGADHSPDMYLEIYMINPDGSGMIKLTNNLVSDDDPALSPDGKKIAFVSNRNGNDSIYVMPAPQPGSKTTPDASQVIRLTDSSGSDLVPQWSPDGQRIVFTSDRDGNTQIYVMKADGSGQTRLTRNTATDDAPGWSPDGKQIVFNSDSSGNSEIYVMNADGTGVKQLTNNPANDRGPVWSPNGMQIAFISDRGGNGGQVYVMQADGSRPTNLSNSPTNDFTVTWSPDGAWLGLSREPLGMFIMRSDGSDQAPINFDQSVGGYELNWGR